MKKFQVFLTILSWLITHDTLAYSANKVWFEFRDDGRYRVYINYTIPELKEYREAYIDYENRKEAEAFYWHLVRGGDFHRGKPTQDHFHSQTNKQNPW